MYDFRVTIAEDELSDGSKAYSVKFYQRGTGQRFSLAAVTYDDAQQLASKLISAIKDHTNEDADWV